jgi:5-(carboxyamino)imidazole ribonucleotide mutase
MQKGRPLVTIVLGSQSDLGIMEETLNGLRTFGIPYELVIASAHRSPQRTRQQIRAAEAKGVELFIAGAGGAAHLPGVIAAETIRPVIGVPVDSSSLHGLDALLSIVQMPGGVPVAAMAIGKAGAKNAAVFAAQCLATRHPEIARRLTHYKRTLAQQVVEQHNAVRHAQRVRPGGMATRDSPRVRLRRIPASGRRSSR